MKIETWQAEYDYLKFEYDRAYYRYVFCSESEKSDAARLLKIWRHKYFDA
jgi:hypothetical protein